MLSLTFLFTHQAQAEDVEGRWRVELDAHVRSSLIAALHHDKGKEAFLLQWSNNLLLLTNFTLPTNFIILVFGVLLILEK